MNFSVDRLFVGIIFLRTSKPKHCFG